MKESPSPYRKGRMERAFAAWITDPCGIVLSGAGTHCPDTKPANSAFLQTVRLFIHNGGISYEEPQNRTCNRAGIDAGVHIRVVLFPSCGESKKVYTVGICQLATHDALDAATRGFQDALKDKLGADNVVFDLKNAAGDSNICNTIVNSFQKPRLLLLDEHTAALDPKTASVVMSITERIVLEERLTTLMITHNMRDAIRYGDRLIMLHAGNIILDISGEEKKNLTVTDLLEKFSVSSGSEFSSDRGLLG